MNILCIFQKNGFIFLFSSFIQFIQTRRIVYLFPHSAKLCYTDVVTKVSGTDSVNAGNSESEGQAVTNVAEGFLAAMGGEVILWI